MMPDNANKHKSLMLGVPLDLRTLDEITEYSLSQIDKPDSQVTFACANPHSLSAAQNDSSFFSALSESTFTVADGVGVTILGSIANIPTGPRISGINYFYSVLNGLRNRGEGRVFFFGSSPETLSLIESKFKIEYPALVLCGTLSPPFREWLDDENDAMISTINRARPDILWVGMTAPKQEKWVEANKHKLNTSIIGSIGAVFDFYAETNKRAPEWICKLGLEWVYRLVKEPRRMWQRTFVSAPRFIWLIIKHHVISRSGR